jgi:HEPN domain-containing protein
MRNSSLALDYLSRSHKRLSALEALTKEQAWPDVVRESQEVVELCLKALLRQLNLEVPRVHDVSSILEEHRDRVPSKHRGLVDEFCKISRELRRDRELAYYGTEDLTPSEFYKEADASRAKLQAVTVVQGVQKIFDALT